MTSPSSIVCGFYAGFQVAIGQINMDLEISEKAFEAVKIQIIYVH